MKNNKILLLLCCLFVSLTMSADNIEEIKKQINSIKKNSNYLYSECTDTTESAARDIAEEELYTKVNNWVAAQKKLQGSKQIVVRNVSEVWSALSMPRGNMYRCFLYVKKKDIFTADNAEVINTEQSQNNEKGDATAQISISYPEVINELSQITDYQKFAERLKTLKQEGKISAYARYANLDKPEDYYLAIYNRQGKVIAYLSTGTSRRNVATGAVDNEHNYKDCGAIGFIVVDTK